MIGEWIDLEGVERRHKYTLCHWLIGGQSLLWVAASLHIPYLLNWNMRPYQIMSCHLNQINRILRTQQETNNWSRNTAWEIIDIWPTDLWSQDFCIISIFHLRYTFPFSGASCPPQTESDQTSSKSYYICAIAWHFSQTDIISSQTDICLKKSIQWVSHVSKQTRFLIFQDEQWLHLCDISHIFWIYSSSKVQM